MSRLHLVIFHLIQRSSHSSLTNKAVFADEVWWLELKSNNYDASQLSLKLSRPIHSPYVIVKCQYNMQALSLYAGKKKKNYNCYNNMAVLKKTLQRFYQISLSLHKCIVCVLGVNKYKTWEACLARHPCATSPWCVDGQPTCTHSITILGFIEFDLLPSF